MANNKVELNSTLGQKTELAKLLDKHFNGLRFRSDHLKQAGKILKSKGTDEVIKYLADKGSKKPANFQPPAKVNIVAKSRDFCDWPIVKCSNAIQEYLYKLPISIFDEVTSTIIGKEAHETFFVSSGVDCNGFRNVQGLNLIFKHAVAIYRGVIKKVENRNNKNLKKLHKINETLNNNGKPLRIFVPEVAFDNDGFLLELPGINKNIYCYQQVKKNIYNPNNSSLTLPLEFSNYTYIDGIIPKIGDRLEIPEGQPGHVPWHQRTGNSKSGTVKARGSKHGRMKRYGDKYSGAILAILSIGEDWIAVDLRGLLRNAYWRKMIPQDGITPQQLLDMFTGDPVIDPIRNIVTFTYNLEHAEVHSEDVVYSKRSIKALKQVTSDGPIALVSIDLGQTNPISARISRLGNDLKPDFVSSIFLPDELLNEIKQYRESSNLLEKDILTCAVNSLTTEQQKEISDSITTPDEAKLNICKILSINPLDIPWDQISSNTYLLTDLALKNGIDESILYFETKDNKTKLTKKVKRRDFQMLKLDGVVKKISDETRKSLNEAIWNVKRNSIGYSKLSQRKKEFTRRSINYIIKVAKRSTRLDSVVFVIEDLTVKDFHGWGKRDIGWDNFFVHKKENRWFIQSFHKEISNLGHNRGMIVIEVKPHNTSRTCPKCGYCDSNNRNGEDFKCLKCNFIAHADLEIATTNLEQVAITGIVLPGPQCERLGDEQSTVPARTRKYTKNKIKNNINSQVQYLT